ncbi:MFS transporter [Actinacidiphila alni]|uniref:MFS transporter n=1 Tax=Actinacidiphila alni TaxID=380248 RepID=UPI00345116D6
MTTGTVATATGRRPGVLGRRFGWLWAAYGVSALGTRLAFGAFPLIAIVVLHAGTTEVSVLAAAGLAVGALVAVPLGPWIEFRRKRPVMIAMDLIRSGLLLSIPVAYAVGRLGFAQLLVVSVVVGAADIAFTTASGAYLKSLVPREDLLVANGRFESTSWTTTMLGPPLGGAAIGLLGPVTTVLADAVSFLLSALGLGAIGGGEPLPERAGPVERFRARDLLDGWRYILGNPRLRPLFFNTAVFNGLIMAAEPSLAVLLLGDLRFAPWQYGLVFAAPCVGGLVGSRLARRLVARVGQRKALLVSGTLRAVWSFGLVFVRPGLPGIVLVIGVELGLITACALFNPVLATYRLEHAGTGRVARTLSAWSVTTKASIAVQTALWGVLAAFTGPRVAIGIAGLCVLATPLLLPWRAGAKGAGPAGPEPRPEPEPEVEAEVGPEVEVGPTTGIGTGIGTATGPAPETPART